jgi:hypothetical protein
MPQTSLVLELQALAQSNATDPGELLRRAKVVAVKLGLKDTTAWMEHELNGSEAETGTRAAEPVGGACFPLRTSPKHALRRCPRRFPT